MIEIKDGRVIINGKETVDPTLIGYALLDFAESTQGDNMNLQLKEGEVFIEKCQAL